MILNRNEKEALWNLFQGGQANGEEMIDAVIVEVLRKLAAGVSVVPYIGTAYGTGPLYNIDQLTTALAAARVQMNEECAELVAHRMDINEPWMTPDDVRSLLGKETK